MLRPREVTNKHTDMTDRYTSLYELRPRELIIIRKKMNILAQCRICELAVNYLAKLSVDVSGVFSHELSRKGL